MVNFILFMFGDSLFSSWINLVDSMIYPGRAVIKFRNLWANPFLTMILYDCNLKCLSYVYMGKIKYV